MEDNKLRNIGILLLVVLFFAFRCSGFEPYDDGNSRWMDGGR